VTTLAGNATVARVSLANPAAPLQGRRLPRTGSRPPSNPVFACCWRQGARDGSRALYPHRHRGYGRSAVDLVVGQDRDGSPPPADAPPARSSRSGPRTRSRRSGHGAGGGADSGAGRIGGAPRYTPRSTCSTACRGVGSQEPGRPARAGGRDGELEPHRERPVDPRSPLPHRAEEVSWGCHAAPADRGRASEFIQSVTAREQAKRSRSPSSWPLHGRRRPGGDGGAPSTPQRGATPGIADAPVIPSLASRSAPARAEAGLRPARFTFSGQTVTQPGSSTRSRAPTDSPAGRSSRPPTAC